MKWLKRRTMLANLFASFLVALFLGLWVNLFTSWVGRTDNATMPIWQHLALVAALFVLGSQIKYNRAIQRPNKGAIEHVIEFGAALHSCQCREQRHA
ncbi:hypothetical protein [Paraburkholderia hospita]|uniref:hypothetical protein n=1 Tax=Paraburkholderia hospita TaxID=169430 RepID=UPI0009A84336|nr:hypothetical protein [Paraburkholderia hospita]SKC69580.1 hypothetical protein SAMN05446934_1962 [Paraburkholderia hospita]